MSFLLPDTDLLRLIQDSTMTETCKIYSDTGALIGSYACRATAFRLFSEPADPYDANVRSMAEWGFTLPVGTPVEVGQTIEMVNRSDPKLIGLRVIVGEVVEGDTWAAAARAWGNVPKTATKRVSITIIRELVNESTIELAPQTVQVVYDRERPEETPVRYAHLGRASYQGGTIVGTTTLNVMVSDRFTLSDDVDPAIKYICYVVEILPLQQQRREAKFLMEVGGVR